MSAATSPETGRRYGVQRVCAAWELPRSTWYAQQAAASPQRPPLAKRGPRRCLSDARGAADVLGAAVIGSVRDYADEGTRVVQPGAGAFANPTAA